MARKRGREWLYVLSTSLVVTTTLMLANGVAGQVRSSTNYQIERDTLNVGGGLGTSPSFQLNTSVGETAPGLATSSGFTVTGGFQQADTEVILSLRGGAAVVMDTAIGGISGGTSRGSTSVNAQTNGAAGYQLTIEASQNPAMQSASDTIANYVPAGPSADTNFVTGVTDAHFAFSPFGTDVGNRWRVNGGTCGSGSASSTACWDGLSTSPITIASASGANTPTGATTTVHFAVGVGGGANQAPGTYVATTTITLLSL